METIIITFCKKGNKFKMNILISVSYKVRKTATDKKDTSLGVHWERGRWGDIYEED